MTTKMNMQQLCKEVYGDENDVVRVGRLPNSAEARLLLPVLMEASWWLLNNPTESNGRAIADAAARIQILRIIIAGGDV